MLLHHLLRLSVLVFLLFSTVVYAQYNEHRFPSPFLIDTPIQDNDKPIEIKADIIIVNAALSSTQAIHLLAKQKLVINAPLRSPAIYLQSEQILEINSEINATTSVALGGTIQVLSQYIDVSEFALLDASGFMQGGSILIGGDFKGLGKLNTAQQTHVHPAARIRNNGAEQGGKVIIWSDNITQFAGSIQAIGDKQGGFVEVSSQDKLTFQGNIDVSALSATGQQGTLLLDPTDLTIGSVDSPAGTLADNKILFADTPTTMTISATTLGSLSGTIILQASNNIIFNQAVNFTNPNTVLQVEAGNEIRLNNPISTSSSVAVTFTAGMGILGDSHITTKGGAIKLTSENGNISLGNLDSSTDSSTVLANAGDISILASNGSVTLANLFADSSFSSGVAGNGGNITLEANNDVTVDILSGQINSASVCNTSCSTVGMGGNVRIVTTAGNLSLPDVVSRSFVVGSTISVNKAGDITLEAFSHNISAGNIDATSRTTSTGSANEGGNVVINVGGNVLAGYITTSSLSSTNTQQAGNVTINALSGAVSLSSIEAQSAMGTGIGGEIQVIVKSLAISGSTTNPVLSIDATGGASSGVVQITLKDKPFIVGDGSVNGTYRDIKSGLDLIDNSVPPNNFSVSYNIGNIFINFESIVTTAADSGVGSLRQAILDTNATAGKDLISFNISPTTNCPHTIALTASLPAISDPLIIDGYAQPSATENTLTTGNNANLCVVLEGSGIVGPSDGLSFSPSATGSLVQGLVINNFNTAGISSLADYLDIQGNFIGINQAGTAAAPNGKGISLDANYIDIGGAYPASSNIISGNTNDGIYLISRKFFNIQGNYIGTDRSVTNAVANGGNGIVLSSVKNFLIGGNYPSAGNVIAGNGGLAILSEVTTNTGIIQYNQIGTSTIANGAAIQLNAQGFVTVTDNIIQNNNSDGINIADSDNNIVYNDIFNNADFGIVLQTSANNNLLSENQIYANGGLGIDLSSDGVSPNDSPEIPVVGGNQLQNYPVLTLADGSNISGTLTSYASESFTLEFFASSTADGTGYGEGEVFLGSTTATTDASGNASFSFPYTSQGSKPFITATATRSNNNTSEFSQAISECSFSDINLTSAADSGAGSLRNAVSTICPNYTIFLNGNNPVLSSEIVIDKVLKIQGAGIISGGNITRLFQVTTNGELTLENLKLIQGSVAGDGGAINNANLTNLKGVTLSNNTSISGLGGAVWTCSTCTLNVLDSVFNNNNATGVFYGGAIYADGLSNIANSTFAQNSAEKGGAIYVPASATLNASNNTISTNTTTVNGGGIYNSGGNVNLRNTLIADNSSSGTSPDVFGVFNSSDNNLIQTITGSSGWIANDITGNAATLGTLSGSPLRLPLLAGSLAINAGNPSSCTFISTGTNPLFTNSATINTDQVGTTRPQVSTPALAARCDIGSFEFNGTFCQAQSQISETECLVLLDIYANNNGAGWIDSATNNWGATLTPCTTWTGVTCSAGKVISIIRNAQNLTGTIPTLSSLTALTKLDLGSNTLTGSIPTTLPNTLQDLLLSHNSLSGTIPSLPTGLISLNVSDNQLIGTVPALPSGLLTLNLGVNQLTALTLPLPSLTTLIINDNKFSGTVPTLPNSLVTFYAQGNAFAGIFPSIAGLTALTALDIGYNAIVATQAGEQALVESKQTGWGNTQTVPPQNLTATALSSTEIKLTWTAIPYIADGGGYKIYYSTLPIAGGGSYIQIATTADKTTNSFIVTGLTPATSYYFALVTATPIHANNINSLLSGYSTEASATTLSVAVTNARYASMPIVNSLIDFGTVDIGGTLTTDIVISEVGDAMLSVDFSGLTGANASDFSLVSPVFPFTIADGAAPQTVTIKCTPSTAGIKNATLTLISNDTSLPSPVYTLQCVGNAPVVSTPVYSSTPLPNSVIQFGTQLIGTTAVQTFSIAEAGNADLVLNSYTLTGVNASDFSLVNPTFPLTLIDGSPTQNVTLHCQPSADGLREAVLTFLTNDLTQPTPSYTLHCTGSTTPVAGYSSLPLVGNVINVGSVLLGKTTSSHLTISEIGTATLTVSTATITGVDSNVFSIETLNLPLNIADGASAQSLMMSCTPESIGEKTATLSLNTNDPTQTTVSYPLTCTGLAPTQTNQAPSDIFLSSNSVMESQPASTAVGNLSTLDADSDDTHSYRLLDNANGLFTLIGNTLYTTTVLSASNTPSLTIRVISTDSGGLSVTKTFVISVTAKVIVDDTPTMQGEIVTGSGARGNNLIVDAPENLVLTGRLLVPPALIGQLADILVVYSWHDITNTLQHSVSINLAQNTPLQADTQWQLFAGNLAFLTGYYDVEFGYRLNNQAVKTRIIQLQVNTNRAPTAIQLSNTQVEEFSVPNQVIGVLSSHDLDKEDHFHYSLLDTVDGRFAIEGNQLVVKNGALINYSQQQTHQITIRSTDVAGASYEQSFILSVEDLQLPADAVVITHNNVLENSVNGVPVGRLLTHQHEGEQYRYTLLNDANGVFMLVNDVLYVADSEALDYESTVREFTLKVRSESLKTDETLEANITLYVQNMIDAQTIGQLWAGVETTTAIASPIKNTDVISVTLQTVIDRTHRGQAGDYFIAAFLIHPDGIVTTDYLLTPTGWKGWDGRLSNLEGTPKANFATYYKDIIWQGALTGFVGYVAIYSGYRVANSDALVVGKPMVFKVEN
ncbi:choice-of-anchor D domain-containing protein [Beggiatoa leptomitoformis]|uniref:Choice-of-anchor D domain-containing protein n=1 Tax=Beggiatoa leptomitoformis TaxID=288004 RepID=A0A2N9YGG6_9GAMM|nr:choice-of-anchor D domain-containing protein [Beggiatoa leptomitoformis]ALG68372.1 choice-of-anchor D domain-containing protein [Beggiatoa leptomitoformis]AUI69306.1 choice-of-anchor D domain-containing protein [Beggiatoa leptomitoformis]